MAFTAKTFVTPNSDLSASHEIKKITNLYNALLTANIIILQNKEAI